MDHRGAEGSLRRLQAGWIDLCQVGVPDPHTDTDETLGALSDLARAGKIRAFGASKVPASAIAEAQWTADRRAHGRFRTEQPPYSILTRAIEYDVLDAAGALGALADEAGLTLIQMAVAFVTRHPAVTSAIIGPRTMEHLDGYLAADGIELSADVLDRIDEIVPPAVTINVADNMWNFGTTALDAAFRRR